MPMTIRDTDLPQPITKAWQIALRKKRYKVIATPPEPEGIPTLLEYAAAGYPAENYNAFVGRRLAERTVVDGELSRMPED